MAKSKTFVIIYNKRFKQTIILKTQKQMIRIAKHMKVDNWNANDNGIRGIPTLANHNIVDW